MLPAIGYALREQNRPILTDPAINACEITFERADDPLRVEKYLQDLEFDHVSIHALKLSVSSPDPPGEKYLKAMKDIAEENNASSVSDHLGFTRNAHEGVEMGHFAPPPYTAEAIDATVKNLKHIQDYFGEDLPFYLENIAYLFQFGGDMSEQEFLTEILKQSKTGWLLDVTNVYANSVNFGYDPYAFITEVMPYAERVQMHLAGGVFDEQAKKYIDSHSHPIPEDVFDLYRHSLEQGKGKVSSIFIERDQEFPDEAGWRSEVRRVRDIMEEVHGVAV